MPKAFLLHSNRRAELFNQLANGEGSEKKDTPPIESNLAKERNLRESGDTTQQPQSETNNMLHLDTSPLNFRLSEFSAFKRFNPSTELLERTALLSQSANPYLNGYLQAQMGAYGRHGLPLNSNPHRHNVEPIVNGTLHANTLLYPYSMTSGGMNMPVSLPSVFDARLPMMSYNFNHHFNGYAQDMWSTTNSEVSSGHSRSSSVATVSQSPRETGNGPNRTTKESPISDNRSQQHESCSISSIEDNWSRNRSSASDTVRQSTSPSKSSSSSSPVKDSQTGIPLSDHLSLMYSSKFPPAGVGIPAIAPFLPPSTKFGFGRLHLGQHLPTPPFLPLMTSSLAASMLSRPGVAAQQSIATPFYLDPNGSSNEIHPSPISMSGTGGRRSDPNRPPPVKKYKCDVCDKAFSRSNTLVTHKRIHTGAKPFKCESCGRAFRQPGNLTRHRQTHTSAKPHVCHHCNKAFNRVSNLQTHMRTHTNYKPFVCQYCGKGFHQKIDMKIHSYTHTGEKPHKCKICGRGFKQLTHLTYHVRTHSEDKMYSCEICGKGFNQKGNLQAHIYGHTGERPHKCDICGKGFTLASTLNTHRRTHAEKKPFGCEHCGKDFYQKNALKNHLLASHPFTGNALLI